MNILMIGGTGLLGSEAAAELIRRGHRVKTISLPPIPAGAVLPQDMQISFGNYMDMPDDALRAHLQGCEGLVFAAGVDERVEGPSPIYEFFQKYNSTPLERLLRLAKEAGVRHVVVCGSYFAYFAKQWPALELTRWHPYIRSRIDQETMALSFADDTFSVGILELPYIFGTQPGRKPVWVFLVDIIRGMKGATFYPKGGTAMVTVRQVGQAIAGALERTQKGQCWPIGYENLTWKALLTIMHKYMGMPKRKVVTVPKWLYRLGSRSIVRKQRRQGQEGGLDMERFADVQCAQTYIDKELGCVPLGVQPDDIDKAIGESVQLCLTILDGKATEMVDMKGA